MRENGKSLEQLILTGQFRKHFDFLLLTFELLANQNNRIELFLGVFRTVSALRLSLMNIPFVDPI